MFYEVRNRSLALVWVSLLMGLITFSRLHAQCSHQKFPSNYNVNPIVSLQHTRMEQYYDIHHLRFDLTLTNTTNEIFSGRLTMLAHIVHPATDTIAFEFNKGYVMDSVVVNGKRLLPAQIVRNKQNDEALLLLSEKLDSGSTVQITFGYHGKQEKITMPFYFPPGITSENNITSIQSEPYFASAWFPAKQVLNDKVDSVFMYVTTESRNQVASNGLLKGVDTLTNGMVTYRWETRYPVAYYLIAVTVGEYNIYNSYAKPKGLPNDSILVQQFVSPFTPVNQADVDLTPTLIEFYSDLLGLYPFHREKYGNVYVPFSGMEHQTMTSLYSYELWINSHEVAHHWFGDQVTCGSWNDIFLNEGFATYLQFMAEEYFAGSSNMKNVQNFGKEYDKGSVYVSNITQAGNIFDRAIYFKGACIIHTLRYLSGSDSLFFEGLRTYLREFSGCNAVVADFKAVMERVTKRDFTKYFDEWYYGEGYPYYTLGFHDYPVIQNNQQIRRLKVNLKNAGSSPQTVPYFTNDLEIKVIKADDTEEFFRLIPNDDDEDFILELTGLEKVKQIIIDPNGWVADSVIVINRIVSRSTEMQALDLKVYPNPTSGNVSLQTKQTLTDLRIQVIDMQGKCIYEASKAHLSAEDQLPITLSGLPVGIYQLHIASNVGFKTERIVIE